MTNLHCSLPVTAAIAIFAASASSQPLRLRIVSEMCMVAISDGGPTQVIGQNTDVSNGYRISVANPLGTSATSTLSVTRAPDAYEVRLDDVTTFAGGGRLFPAVISSLRIELTAIRPTSVQLDARWTLSQSGVWVGPRGAVNLLRQTLTTLGGAAQGGNARTFEVGPNPVVVELWDYNYLDPVVQMRWTLRFTPAPPCAATAYGPACGAALTVGYDFLEPGLPFAELTVAGQPIAGVVIGGVQRQSIPIFACTLLNEAQVIVPVTTRLRFVPPDPGLSMKLQGATLDGGQLVMSEGMDFACR